MSDTSPNRDAGGPAHEAAPIATAPASGAVERGGAASEREDADVDPSEALIGTTLAERYRIEELLGSGGMGAVFRAQHVHMKKNVAVKVLHKEMTYLPEVVARFEREAVAAARIEHPNVAAATAFGQLDDGAFYLVLEYVEGTSLRDLIKQHGALQVSLALYIARQIADALSAAHASEIVHRDLKPDNVMLIQRENDPYFAKVLDFGIAKLTTDAGGPQLTQLGSVFGTPEYMSPEQAAGTPCDARSDLYTLGIMLYEMLSGQTPFDDDDLVVVLTRQMTMDPAPLPPSIPEEVQALVRELLAKDAERRVQSAADLVLRIDALLQTTPEPASASPANPLVESSSQHTAAAVSAQYGDTVLSLARPELSQPMAETPNTAVVGKASHTPQLRTGLTGFFVPLFRRVPVLEKRVALLSHSVPVWGLAVAAAGLVALGFVIVVTAAIATGGRAGGDAAGTTVAQAPAAPDLQDVMERAKGGDRSAIAVLQGRSENDRTSPEWYALGRGLSVIGHVKPALSAYEQALLKDPGLASDSSLVKDVLRAAENQATTADALDLSVRALGAVGADLVYEVFMRTKGRGENAVVHKAAKARLDGPALRGKASPALLVVLDLNKARGCAAVKPVALRAASHADARALTKLKAFTAQRGCGFLGLSDCYACLRGGTALSDAIKRANATPAPKF